VRWQTELEGFSQNAEGVTANLRTRLGDGETLEARFLAACDGARSPVRHALGIDFGGSTLERLFYVADVGIDWKFAHDALHVCFARNTITAFFPMKGDRQWRVVGTFPEGLDRDEGEILYDEIERQIVKDTELKLDITNVNWFSTYKVHSRHVGKFSEGRCFLAGDAAHIHTPAGAQGMNTGIQDGYNLAWKLSAVLKGQCAEGLLDTYNEERLPNARRLLQTTDRLFQFGASDNPLVAFLRINVFPYVANLVLNLDAVRRFVFPLISQIGVNYRESSLSVCEKNLAVKAGDRMPYFEIEGRSIYERLREPKFHLLVFSDGGMPVQAGEDDFGGLADVHALPLYPNISTVFGTKKTVTIMLRPDNYIGYIAEGFSVEKAKSYLSGVGFVVN
jgi:hypothetical protein